MKKPLTARQIRSKYTAIVRYLDQNDNVKWNTYFVVGPQQFQVGEHYVRSEDTWTARQLAIALERLIANNQTKIP